MMLYTYTLFSTFAVHHLVLGIGLFLLLNLLFRFVKVSAEIRSWLWATAFLAATLVPFAAFVPDNIFRLTMQHTIVQGDSPVERVAMPMVEIAGEPDTPLWHVPEGFVFESVNILSMFLVVWLIGSLWRFIQVLRSCFNTLSLLRQIKPLNDLEQDGIVVASSQKTSTPMVVGLFNPVVILPETIVKTMTAEQLLPIIMHELAHVKRGDLWFSLVQELLAIVFWWSPVMRGFNRQIHINRELACDFRAVKALNSPKQYAQSLLDCAKIMVSQKQNVLSVGLFSKKKELTERIEAALCSKQERTSKPLSIVAACAALALTTAATAQNFAPKVSIADVERNSRHYSRLSRLEGEALLNAVERGDRQTLKFLIEEKGIDINTPAIGDGTALISAVRSNKPDIVVALMEMGADIDQSSRGDGNPLIMAAMTNNLKIAKMLIGYGADVNAVVTDDETALINASRRGSLEMTQLLVENGADVNLKVVTRWVDGSEMRSPLNMARTKAVKNFLLSHGATK